ncbi:thioredoxin family protein [Hydrogenobacter thermophilus]|uniref:thioredoxin family protein n=1 Tax=Hydrogenobacter thermophilus TaxID=940 RepID=UPI0030F8ADCB
MKSIKIISASECTNCQLLYNVVSAIVKAKGLDAKVEKVIDISFQRPKPIYKVDSSEG